MKKIYLVLISFLLISFIVSCSKGGKGGGIPVQPSLLVGKWNLQQQKTVLYVDGVTQTDTTYLATINNTGYAQFNKDNSFSSASMLLTFITGGNVPGDYTVIIADSTSGTYNMVSSTLTLSTNLAGLGGGIGTISTGTSVPVFKLISNSTQITLLTATTLNMHTEYIYTATTTANTKTYKNELDYYYGK